MFITDFLKLLKRNWAIAVIVPSIMVLICIIVLMLMPIHYKASLILNVSGSSSSVASLVKNSATPFLRDGVELSVTPNSIENTVSISCSGLDADECEMAVKTIAAASVKNVSEVYPKVSVFEAERIVVENQNPDPVKSILIVLFSGLVFVVLYLLIWNEVKKPLISKKDIERRCVVQCIAQVPGSDLSGEKALARLSLLASNYPNRTIGLVPVSNVSGCEIVCDTLKRACVSKNAKDEGNGANEALLLNDCKNEFRITCCMDLNDSASALYEIASIDIVVIVAKQWIDSIPAFVDVLDELKIVKANVAGYVLVE